MNHAAFADQRDEKPMGEFGGKYVTLYLDAERERGIVLKDAGFREVGGRMMLVGVDAYSEFKEDWPGGVQVGVAWDTVALYYSMTPEQFQESAKKHTRRKEPRQL